MLNRDKQNSYRRLRNVPMMVIANIRTALDWSISILAMKGEGLLEFHPSQKIYRLMEEEEMSPTPSGLLVMFPHFCKQPQ